MSKKFKGLPEAQHILITLRQQIENLEKEGTQIVKEKGFLPPEAEKSINIRAGIIVKQMNEVNEFVDFAKSVDYPSFLLQKLLCVESFNKKQALKAVLASFDNTPARTEWIENTRDILLNLPRNIKYLKNLHAVLLKGYNTINLWEDALNDPKLQIKAMKKISQAFLNLEEEIDLGVPDRRKYVHVLYAKGLMDFMENKGFTATGRNLGFTPAGEFKIMLFHIEDELNKLIDIKNNDNFCVDNLPDSLSPTYVNQRDQSVHWFSLAEVIKKHNLMDTHYQIVKDPEIIKIREQFNSTTNEGEKIDLFTKYTEVKNQIIDDLLDEILTPQGYIAKLEEDAQMNKRAHRIGGYDPNEEGFQVQLQPEENAILTFGEKILKANADDYADAMWKQMSDEEKQAIEQKITSQDIESTKKINNDKLVNSLKFQKGKGRI